MDNTQTAGSSAPSSAKGKPGGIKKTGKSVSKKAARKNAAAARKAAGRPKGRGRNKIYEDQRVQAAYDRQKALRDLYSEVSSAIKPVLDELADRSVKTLIENPTAHQEVAEFQVLQQQLDDRLEEVMAKIHQEFKTRTMIATREYQLNCNVTEKKYHDSFNDLTEDFLDASLNRANLLAELRREGVGLDFPDTTYAYVQKSNHVVEEQGSWTVCRNGIKVPYPHLLEENKKAAAAKAQTVKGKPAPKRKAEDQPDGQPDSKKSNGLSGSARPENGDETSTPLPRHTKGLLSAEMDADGEPESNAPSPTPDTDLKAEVYRGKKDAPDLPASASEPDRWGVRTVNKRGPKANNRLILPPAFAFDDDEIGFRDSTNDGSKKATRGTRGKYLNNPNPRNLHLDRTIVTYDCLSYGDDDLDPELVEKHNLHPKYGLFVRESRNGSESPKPHVDGTRPIVVITPDGSTLQASRTVRNYKMDLSVTKDAAKDRMASLVAHVCEEDEIAEEDVTTEEMRKRKEELRVSEPAEHILLTTEDTDGKPEMDGLDTGDTLVDELVAAENIGRLLSAASYVEHERPTNPTSSQRLSRPYDAVRDVFTNAEPARPAPAPVDTSGLSFLADVSEQVSQQRVSHYDPRLDHRLEPHHADYHPDYHMEHHHPPSHIEYRPDYRTDHRASQLEHRVDQADVPSMADSMIDPRLLGPPNPPAPVPNSFLQTALNHQPTLTHIAPLPPQGAEPHVPVPVGRNPFTANARASPVLPPLRPPRREKPIEPTLVPPPTYVQPPPSDYGSSFGMMQTNSGNFFPPAPSRAYHQGYTFEHGPLMPLQQGYSNMGPAHPSSQMNHPYGPSYRPVSPTMATHTPLGTLSLHIPPHGTSVSPPGSSMGLHSPTGLPGSRHRASISSGSNSSNNAKYRKIAAAPIPHNRPWPANGGAELRLAHYDHKEAIKDYRANEPPPRSGPTTIRGWNVNNVAKGRKGLKKEDLDEKESPNITTFINKWNASDKTMG